MNSRIQFQFRVMAMATVDHLCPPFMLTVLTWRDGIPEVNMTDETNHDVTMYLSITRLTISPCLPPYGTVYGKADSMF
ncbi:hypothetical protein BHE90_011112, partial [Fusarium euwallaceae]